MRVKISKSYSCHSYGFFLSTKLFKIFPLAVLTKVTSWYLKKRLKLSLTRLWDTIWEWNFLKATTTVMIVLKPHFYCIFLVKVLTKVTYRYFENSNFISKRVNVITVANEKIWKTPSLSQLLFFLEFYFIWMFPVAGVTRVIYWDVEN